jgi:hypothetical protein
VKQALSKSMHASYFFAFNNIVCSVAQKIFFFCFFSSQTANIFYFLFLEVYFMDFFGGRREEIFIYKEQSILLGGVKVPQRWSLVQSTLPKK